MLYIKVQQLDGIPDSYVETLSAIAKKVKREELLAIVLFFMSGLDDEGHSHENIKRNMKKIHDGNYKEYAASNIRGYFDKETQKVNQGKLDKNQRLFLNVKKGYWRNTVLGNILAKHVLEEYGYDIYVKNQTNNDDDLHEVAKIEEAVQNAKGKERIAETKIRVNQGKFRKNLLDIYSSCALCNLSKTDLLIASHIKSWSDSTADEKLLCDNGLLLCPNHDALFDKHYISFDASGLILIDESLDQDTLNLVNINSNMRIDVREGSLKFLEHHKALFLSKRKQRI